ncbi:AAA family ATPase [Persicobacter diffluens]|uniref:AAA domain-containing protein n=1 Tax=Persicobacter diffluens TaxID=981 RepID=A0AAN5AMK7_9BACT|nr:hypothetical protein PEDI_51060 [Persicobacter diffluens]
MEFNKQDALNQGLAKWIIKQKKLLNISAISEETGVSRTQLNRVLEGKADFNNGHFNKLFPVLKDWFGLTEEQLIELVQDAAKILAFWNQKGGVGKTTCCNSIAGVLTDQGKKVLVMDCDYQGNSTSLWNIDKQAFPMEIMDALEDTQGELIRDCIVQLHDISEQLYILPSYGKLNNLETSEKLTTKQKLESFKNIVNKIRFEYDYILMDMRPDMYGLFSEAPLGAAEWVFLPVEASLFSFDGLSRSVSYLKERKKDNPLLKIGGAFFNRTKPGKNQMEQIENYALGAEREGIYVFESIIRDSVGIQKAFTYRYDPTVFLNKFNEGEIADFPKTQLEPIKNAKSDFMELTTELLNRIQNG